MNIAMDHRGHPKNPIVRANLPLERIAAAFVTETVEEAPDLARQLRSLNADGMRELGGVLGRFDTRGKGELDGHARLLARRVLTRLQRPGVESLTLTNKVLDYLDLNVNALLDEEELELGLQIVEMFCRAESNNNTLTVRELQCLYALLRNLDRDGNGQLDPMERHALHKGLGNPEAFLAEDRKSVV